MMRSVVADDLGDQIRSLIGEVLRVGIDSLTDDMTVEQLGIDSLMFAEIVLMLEKQLNINMNAAEALSAVGPETPLNELVRLLSDPQWHVEISTN